MPHGRVRRRALPAALVALAVWSALTLDLGAGARAPAWGNLRQFLDRAVPPDGSVLPQALTAMVETLQMALLGTLAAVLAAVPLAVLASRNLFPGPVGALTRALLAGLRTLPAIVWALILVAIVGVGVLPGVLALAVYTVGFLGKLQFEAIEGLPPEPADALRAIGVSRLQLIRHVVLPESGNALVSHTLFAFDYNVRHASVLGIVGAGGIGTLLMGYLTFFQLDRLLTVLGVIFVTVLAIDAASHALRARYLHTPVPAHSAVSTGSGYGRGRKPRRSRRAASPRAQAG